MNDLRSVQKHHHIVALLINQFIESLSRSHYSVIEEQGLNLSVIFHLAEVAGYYLLWTNGVNGVFALPSQYLI